MYHNVLAQTSQINFLQQQQQQQQQQQSNIQQQPMPSQRYYCYPANQQGGYPQNQYGQSYQQDPYGVNQPQPQQQQIPRSGVGNIGLSIGHQAYNVPSIMQTQTPGYGSLPAHILDQIRPYISTPGPIFILPNNCPTPVTVPQAPTQPSPTMGQGCPGLGINCPPALYCPASSCYPYPMPMPLVNPFAPQHPPKETPKNCGCCSRRPNLDSENQMIVTPNYNDDHQCQPGSDDTVCTRRNCPSAINLQALASQLLAIQGIIPCAATRLVLRKVAGSNVTTTIDETIERAKRSLSGLSREQLLSETRHAQQVNALINLHMTANPPPNVLPILTTVQLKVNLLKAHVDSSINRRLSEGQGVDGAIGSHDIDPVILALRSDQELRELLATLREKECEERVNLNFAPYQSQRVIAESRLSNVQNKISQVEAEMERRRSSALPRSPVAQQFSDPGWYGYTGDISNTSSFAAQRSTRNSESPDPFRIQVRSPKRLNLQPHVGSPETTYETKKKPLRRAQRKESDEDDDESPKNSAREASNETRRCACDKSSEDESADEGKKKLGGRIIVGGNLVSMSEVDDAGVSMIKLSPNVVIVIDRNGLHGGMEAVCGRKVEVVAREAKSDAGTEMADVMVPRESSDETGRKKPADEESSYEAKSRRSMEAIDAEKSSSTEKPKKFKWLKKKDKVGDQTSGLAAALVAPVEEGAENRAGDKFLTAKSAEDESERSTGENYETAPETGNRKREPVREETVRMITKIDYKPSAFGAYLGTGDPPEKDRVVEPRYKGDFTEDSLKSTSTESTADPTPESISLRVEDYEEIRGAMLPPDSKENPEKPLDKEIQMGEAIIRGDGGRGDDDENGRAKRIAGNQGSEANNYGKGLGYARESKDDQTEEDLTSGDLSTIGNYVESFGSIIGKIATLKLHRVGESSHSLFGESSMDSPNGANASVGESEESSGTGRGNSSLNDEDARKEIGRWRYIKFAEVEESIPNSSAGDDSPNAESSTFILPRIKHSVIEDKTKGEKYVVIEEPSEERSRGLGEPYRTGRSLVIRSRLKSAQSSSTEKSGPFTVVKSPKHRDKNCLPLRITSSKSSEKNRCKNSHELKSSDKFWIRPDEPETGEKEATVKQTENPDAQSTHGERCRSVANENDSPNEERSPPDSAASVVDERVVEVHDYSKTRISSRPVTVENTEHIA